METSVRGERKGKTAVSCDYSCACDLHNQWIYIANEDCVVLHKGNMSLDQPFSFYSHAGLRSGGRQAAEEI